MPFITLSKLLSGGFVGEMTNVLKAAIHGAELTAEQAIAHGLCPETGVPLDGLDTEAHIALLWPRTPNEDAVKRIQMIRDWAKKQAALAEEAIAETAFTATR
jgi:hypothetical protein